MIEMVSEPDVSTFYLLGYLFDSIAISLGDVLKSEAVSVECGLEPRCAIDEKLGVVDIVFLTEFSEEQFRDCRRSAWIEADVENLISLGIDGGVRPELVVIDPNHCLVVERDLIRCRATGRL